MFLTIIKCQTIAIVLGYILDLIIGDPHWLYHPVQLIGRLITFFEKLLLKKDDKDGEKYIKGAVLAVLVLLITGAVVILLLAVFYNISIVVGCIAETIMCYQILAVKSLRVESMKVYAALKQEGMEQARIAVSMIVGRDTMQLDNHGVIRAAVETVAENTSDGVVAPLFYMLFFGAPGGFIYKAVNTMDSMIGYKNDKYMYFGRFAAKMDDVFIYRHESEAVLWLQRQVLHRYVKSLKEQRGYITALKMHGKYIKGIKKSTAVLMQHRQRQPVQVHLW